MRHVQVSVSLLVLLSLIGCDIAGGKACYFKGEKIEKLLDANGSEWSVSGKKVDAGTFLETEECVVSKKAVPLGLYGLGISGHLLTEDGKEIEVVSGDQFHWWINRAQWTKAPEGWDE